MNLNLYRDESDTPKLNAQRNLASRTHYVDDDTLRFHKSRILSCHITDGGLLLGLVESVATTYDGSTRGFRAVVFDVAGNVLNRTSLDECHKTRRQSTNDMWRILNATDAYAVTLEAINSHQRQAVAECDTMRGKLEELMARNAVAA